MPEATLSRPLEAPAGSDPASALRTAGAISATEAGAGTSETRAVRPVRVELYRWAGRFGPLEVKTPCGECRLTEDILQDVLQEELREIPTELARYDWLSVWWRPLLRGGWHAPVVVVDGRVVSQGVALNRGVLTQAVVEAHARRAPLEGTFVFGKDTCPHCTRAKRALEAAGIAYRYRDVISDPRALFEMLQRAKPHHGLTRPITVPQIWVDGAYVGGADALEAALAEGQVG